MFRRSLLRGAAALCFSAALALPALSAHAADMVTLDTLDGRMKPKTVQVPADPNRIAVLDAAVLDMLDNWNLGDRIVSLPKTTSIPFLAKYFDPKNGIADVGTLKEVNMEALMASEPDVIFISGRLVKKYDELSRIAPVVYMTTDRAAGTLESFRRNLTNVAKLFGREADAQATYENFKARAEAIKKHAEGKTALVGLVTASHVNLLGNSARCSLIGNEFGFTNVAEKANANHGNESSFELLLKLNPDFFFVLDRDSAIGRPGAKLAADVLNNDMVNRMKAKEENHIAYLTPSAWYLAEGGITAMEIMFTDVERALGIAKEAK